MMWTVLRRAVVLPILVAGGALGCGALDVSDPTAIEEGELSDAAGAQQLRVAALRAFAVAVGRGALNSGLLADEFLADRIAEPGDWQEDVLDRRWSVRYEELATSTGFSYQEWQELRLAASVALPKLLEFGLPGAREAQVGEMFAVRAFGALRLAEDFCPGFPLHEVADYKVLYGDPLSTEAAFARALADFDSADVYGADSARVLNFARVGRARVLLNLGQFADAANVASDVPVDYVYQLEYSGTVGPLNLLAVDENGWRRRWRSVADREGGNGLDFVSANDPRVPTTLLGTSQDGTTGLYGVAKYPNTSTPIVVASGIEARLIEAEVALQAGEPTWLTILNDLRASQSDPALDPLDDPGTTDARVDLLFRERAFWLFGTGHRLADLRRLIRLYGRDSESVFPAGVYRLGGEYQGGTSIPFSPTRETPHNPAVTGCTAR